MALIKPKLKRLRANNKQLDLLRRKLKGAQGAAVTVGVHAGAGTYETGEDVAFVALCNEFGTKNIPERSFLRSTLNESEGVINNLRIDALKHILNDGWSIQKGLEYIGTNVVILIQNKIRSNVPPQNAASTQQKKQDAGVAQRTLIFSGLMLRSVQYRIVTQNASG